MTTAEPPEAVQIFQQFKISCLLKIFGTMAGVCEAFCFFRVFCGLKFSYYYRSFSYFSEKIFSKAWSFRMMPFPPREAMTTAEQTEAVQIFSNSRYHVCSKSSAPWPTSARHLFIPCVLWTKIFVLLSFIFLFFDNDFFHALFCRAKRFHNRRSRRSRLHHPQSTSCFIIESSGCRRPGGEAFQCIQCILWFEISCSFVPFVVTENIWLWPTATPGRFVSFVVQYMTFTILPLPH